LLEVLRPQLEGAVVKRLLGEEREDLGIDLEDLLALESRGADAFLGEEAIGGLIRAERQEFLVDERRGGHAKDE
jgi:hypothetical protein